MHYIVCAFALLGAPGGDTSFPLPHDVIIHEIMTDPSPPVSLPEFEYVELRNVSPRTVNLAGWKLCGNGGSATLPAFALEPGGYVVVCPRRGAPFFHPVADAGGFFALHNDEDLLALEAPSGRVVHAVSVDMRLFAGSFKSSGGWSLEMKDPSFPCAGPANWAFSTDPSGGTPGRANSVAAPIAEPPLPVLLRSTTPDSQHVRLHFFAPVDSASAASAAYEGRAVAQAVPEPPAYTSVLLTLSAPLSVGEQFRLKASGLRDCLGRAMPAGDFLPCGRPASPANLVISEVLPDPVSGQDDFVEIYNDGGSPVELADLRWAAGADGGGWKAPSPVARRPFLLFPGEYVALSPAPEALCRQYACLGRVERATLPALGAEAGKLGLFSREGLLLDEAAWDRKFHAPELAVTKGVSFERLDFGAPGLQGVNWHSAASTAGFATPGYANSQRSGGDPGPEWCSLAPGAFSPNNDGAADLAWIHWRFPAPGFRVDVRIFDAAGRPVRHLANNVSAAAGGRMSWNGLGDNGLPLPRGSYAIRVAAWNGGGRQMSRKMAVVLLRD